MQQTTAPEPEGQLANLAAVAVIIPTYNRGRAVLSVLERVQACWPRPQEIWIHIDLGDGILEREIRQRFPIVQILTSATRLGPGGGRHRCLSECRTPYAVSFDDDSYPIDADFFSTVERLFLLHPTAAVIGASIWHRNEPEKNRTNSFTRIPTYIGCGYAIRLDAYRKVRGLIPRRIPYGMEESDLSLQLFESGWHIYESGGLRVLHDTELKHHNTKEITAGCVTNVGLYAFLHYPLIGWGWGLAQVLNIIVNSIRKGRFRGILSGLLKIPRDCYRHRQYRKPIAWRSLKSFLRFRRTGVLGWPSEDEIKYPAA